MANIFPPNTNKRFYGIAALVALAAAFVLGGIYYVNFSIPEYEPVQPVRFSHKLHAGDLKMSCTACHSAAHPEPAFRIRSPVWAATSIFFRTARSSPP